MSDDFLRQLLPNLWSNEHSQPNQENDDKEAEANERLRLLALQASRSDNPYDVLKSLIDPSLARPDNTATSTYTPSTNQSSSTSVNSSTYPLLFPTSSSPAHSNSLSYPQTYDEYSLSSTPSSIPQAAATTATKAASNTLFEDLSPSTSAVPQAQQEPTQDDKRRRNTLASARFRDRKKQRENALEAIVDRLRTQSEVLEGDAINLRKENSWLLSLLELDGAKQALQQQSSNGSTSNSSNKLK